MNRRAAYRPKRSLTTDAIHHSRRCWWNSGDWNSGSRMAAFRVRVCGA